jgi:hypothetical protein
VKLLPINIAAKRLGLSTESIYRLGREHAESGKGLKIIQTGPRKGFRVREEDLLRFISIRINESD